MHLIADVSLGLEWLEQYVYPGESKDDVVWHLITRSVQNQQSPLYMEHLMQGQGSYTLCDTF